MRYRMTSIIAKSTKRRDKDDTDEITNYIVIKGTPVQDAKVVFQLD